MVGSGSDILWRLEEVGFGYRELPVLSGLNLELARGRCYGVLGPNGSGKTTLLDLLCGLLTPDSGRITLAGRALSSWHRGELARKVALVPQEFTVRFGFTVREVVEMGRHPWLGRFSSPGKRDYELVDQVMDELGIGGLAERSVTELSGGEKQRVAVARALAQEAEVLLLDEATSNLDIYHSLSILGILRSRVREGGLTIIAALHDLNLAGFFCEQMIFLQKGQLRYMGAVNEVLRPEVIAEVYGVEARVRQDNFAGCPQVTFKGVNVSDQEHRIFARSRQDA